MRRPRLILAAAAVMAITGLAALVWAQTTGEPVLHEYFNPWDADIDSAANASGEPTGAQPSEQQGRAIEGEPPELSVNPNADEVIFGSDGPVDPGSTSTPYGPLEPGQTPSQLDDNTDRVDQLNYYANFEPSIIPYKRMVVQNTAQRSSGGDYSVTLASSRYQRRRVAGGEPRSGEDGFWGSFLLRTQKNSLHPIPSVAPDQRILEVQAEPDVAVSFVRDAADNYFVKTGFEGVLRLNIRVAAPRTYFAGGFASSVAWSQFPGDAVPTLPAEVRKVAAEVLEGLSISRQMTPRQALRALVEHYRNFEGRELPEELDDKDLYAALSRAQIGVCRHRSLAFLISAQALGIPTRYVYNEAHAFVEVYWPSMGWRRIDLGGAANELNYSGRAGGSTHDSGRDNLPQPPNYVAEIERMQGPEQAGSAQSDDGSEAESEGAQASSPQTDAASGDSSQSLQQGADAQMSAAQIAAQEQAEQTGGAEQSAQSEQAGQSEALGEMQMPPESAEAPGEARRKVIIDVEADAVSVFRGNSLGVKGSLFTDQGMPVADETVEVFLGPVGARSEEALIRLGSLETEAGGQFSGKLSIPDRVSIGRWSLILVFEGNEKLQPARAD